MQNEGENFMNKIAIASIVAVAALCPTISNAGFEPVKESPALWANIPQPLKRAKWISPNYPGWFHGIHNSYSLLRASFNLDSVPKAAPLYITADQCYRLYINGKFVASGPARGYQQSWPFDEIDASKYLAKGKNVIAVRYYNAGRSTFGYLTQGTSGAIFALDLGNGKEILSNGNVRSRRQSGCSRDTEQISIQMNNQEHIDLREEDPAWKEVSFDDSKWGRSSERVFNTMPYYQMESRMIPMLEEFEVQPQKLTATGVGQSIDNSEKVFDVAKLFAEEKLESKENLNSSLTATAAPTKDGEFRNFVFDFGKMMVGMPILKIEGAKGGEIVDVLTTEITSGNTGLIYCGSNLAPANRLICRAGDQTHDFFNIFGCRYMTVRVRNNPNSTLKITPLLRWSAYPLGDRGKFKTSNAAVDKIWEACKQTQKVCSLDSYVDTPYREQAQWWGDARVQAWNTFFISGDDRLLRRGIRSISMQKAPNGLTYGHAPTMAHNCILPDFSLTWILTVWDHYWQTGSPEAYLNHKDTIDSILSYFDGVTNPKTGLVEYDPRYWLFLDWCAIQKKGQPALLNLWLLDALEKTARLCRETGLDADAKKYSARADRVRGAITANLLCEDGLLCDGILEDGSKNPLKGIQVQTLAKMTGIKGFDFEKAKVEVLLPFINGEKEFKNSPSSYWVVYVMQVLCDAGNNKEVYEYIKRNWKEFADYGTAFENFGASSRGTHSHAWSAHPAFLLPQILGGVKQESAGWTKISYSPNRFEDFAEIVYPTPQGDIKSGWKKKADGGYTDALSVPKGVKVIK